MNKKLMHTLMLGGALWAGQAMSHHVVNNLDVGNMAEEADAVIHGTVVDIKYRDSEGAKNQPGIPHTFVTFSVEDVLSGDVVGKTLTLRFMGGPTKNGGSMMSNQVPKFNLGDQDILFVRDNGIAECPLVECANGRFRVVDDKMFNEYGQQIVQDNNNKLALGRTEKRDEFNGFFIGNQEIKRKFSEKFTEDGNGVEPTKSFKSKKLKQQGRHMERFDFSQDIREKMNKKPVKGQKQRVKFARNMDSSKPFKISASKHVALPEPAIKANKQPDQNEPDQFEIEEMRLNRGNPVLD